MFFKLKHLFVSAFVMFSLFSYKENQATAIKIDVTQASGPVRFTFTLSQSIPYISANKAISSGYKGQDTYIVIIDTGIEKAHPFFQDRVALEACFSTRCPNGLTSMIGSGAAAPVHFHGTHVAGIAAGYNTQFTGVAPEAKIIAVNVFDVYGGAFDGDIIKALQWVDSISDQYNIASVNMSLGGSTTFTTTCDNYIPSLTSAIKSLYDKGIATVVASGNSYAYGMSSPACISYSVSVAATDKTSDAIMNFSNINTHTSLAAPGNSITSSKLLGSYGAASGTSMSSPFVAGAFAVYRSKFGKQSVSKVLSDFQSTGKTATDSYTNIKVQRLDMQALFADVPATTTTTTIPSSTTTSSTTVPESTTTTTLVSTTTTLVATTTTQPVVTTTSTTLPPVTTIAPPTKLPNIPRPLLLELNGLPKSYVWVKYKDPYTNKAFIDHYELTCNNSIAYNIPKENLYSIHSYKLEVPASSIAYCYITGITIYGTKTVPSSTVKIYPRNKTLTSSSIVTPKKNSK